MIFLTYATLRQAVPSRRRWPICREGSGATKRWNLFLAHNRHLDLFKPVSCALLLMA
jgi:hypothetical protein